MDCVASASAYMNPVQPAERSNAPEFTAPSPSWIRQAVAGNVYSGVAVATTIKSISCGRTPALSSASLAAANPIEADVSFGLATRRSRMPVRVTIHSSLVSTVRERSALVTTLLGTYLPQPTMWAWRPFLDSAMAHLYLLLTRRSKSDRRRARRRQPG